jgi:Peptidase family M20/M25/M40
MKTSAGERECLKPGFKSSKRHKQFISLDYFGKNLGFFGIDCILQSQLRGSIMVYPTYLKVTDDQFNNATTQLTQFVAIESVGNVKSPDCKSPLLYKAAIFAGSELIKLGFQVDYVKVENSAPYVVAQKIINKNLPTVLLYSYYDVHSVDWTVCKSAPFVLKTLNDRFWGQGACCGKGQIIAILTVLTMYQQAKLELPVNVKILFEGEKESGSLHLEELLEQTANKLNANAMIIFDGMNTNVNFGILSCFSGANNLLLESTIQEFLHNTTDQIKETAPEDYIGKFTKAYLQAMQENFAETGFEIFDETTVCMHAFNMHFPEMEIIVPSFEDPATNPHSYNESQSTVLFKRAINSLSSFFEKAAYI